MISSEQLSALRKDTPGAEKAIHLNNAGAALMPAPVVKAIQDHITLEAQAGGYEAAAAVRAQADGFYTALGQLLQAPPQQIAFSGSATQAYNTALSAIPFEAGDTILTTNEDYVSNQLAFLQLQKNKGVRLVRVEDEPSGGLDCEDLEKKIKIHRPRLVAVTHVPTSTGLIQDVYTAGKLCQQYDCLYLLDACQSVGQMVLDINQLHCDFLTATFRKFLRGPRGVGFLYVSKKVLERSLEPSFLDLHSAEWLQEDEYRPREDARRFETWERSYALMLGAKAATEYALGIGMPAIQSRAFQLAALLREELSTIEGVELLSRGKDRCCIISVKLKKWEHPQALHQEMMKHGINCSITYQNSALIDYRTRKIPWSLRLSPHYYNTASEIRSAAAIVQQIV
jgi:selenocysteine lyase/cysteine desulfurase